MQAEPVRIERNASRRFWKVIAFSSYLLSMVFLGKPVSTLLYANSKISASTASVAPGDA
jgi:hypothetical protein